MDVRGGGQRGSEPPGNLEDGVAGRSVTEAGRQAWERRTGVRGGGEINGPLGAASTPELRAGRERAERGVERRGRGGRCDLHGRGEEVPRGCHARGEELRVRSGEDPTELNAESLDPTVSVPRREAGETPASGRLAPPPALFPFLPVPRGVGIARGAWGEMRQVRSPPSRRRRRLPPSSPQFRAGLPWARPVGAHAGTQGSQVALRLGVVPLLSPSLVGAGLVGPQPILLPNCGSSQMTPIPLTDLPHLFRNRFTFFVDI